MKRNMKFLLLLAIFTSSIMAAYFITGCGDDSTVIDIPAPLSNDTTTIVEEPDRVVGSVQGTVSSAYDGALLAGVEVTWTKNDQDFYDTTNADGYYLIDDSLSSGYYVLTFSMNGYALYTTTIYVKTIGEIKQDIDNDPVHGYEYMVTANIGLYPTTATVTGIVYTALPAPENKDQNASLALDDPTLVSRASGVTVMLQYEGLGVIPSVYTTTTDAAGVYTFINVPLFMGDFAFYDVKGNDGPDKALATGDVSVTTLPFDGGGDSTFEGTTQLIEMVPPPEATVVPSIFAPLFGNNNPVFTDKPVVLTYNFERTGFGVTGDPQMTFSRSMDTLSASISLEWWNNGWEDVPFAYAWTSSDAVLTLNPALDLLADGQYRVTFSGNGMDGLALYNGTWQRSLWTQQGMRVVSTNLDDYGDADNPFKDFPLDANITVTFDMDVNLANSNGWVVLRDNSNNREVNATISASGATVTVNPTDSLKSNSTYELDFRIYSNLRGDYVNDDEVSGSTLYFTSFNNATEPGVPQNFALDMGANYKADFNTTMLNFKWTAVSNADYYEIYASDNMNNTDIIVVTDNIDHVDFLTMQAGSVDFTMMAIDSTSTPYDTTYPNAGFDLYVDDTLDNGNPLITPFSGGTVVSFQVRALNSWGPGAFSTPVTVADETPPTFTAVQGSSADNTAGATPDTIDVDITGTFGSAQELEYVSSIAFSFVEMGGDSTYLMAPGDVNWTWDLDMRDGGGLATIAAGKCASQDEMIVSVTDNSGNTGVDTISLLPYLIFTAPTDTTTGFEAPSPGVDWTISDAFGTFSGGSGSLDLFWSDDGGATWADSALDWFEWDEDPTTWSAFDTVFSSTFMLGLRDNDGGWIWPSEVFTYTGIDVTGPDSAWLDTSLFYDRAGVDSTGVPITFAYAGLDSVLIQYKIDAGAWTDDTVIAVTGGTGSYTFYAPDNGGDYTCNVRVADWDADNRPSDEIAWTFSVTNDWTDLTHPSTGNTIAGGAIDTVRWDTTAYSPHLTSGTVGIEYSLDRGATWMVIDSAEANDGKYPWSVPATIYANDSAQLRIVDKFSNQVLDASGNFTISGIVIDSPTVGTEWLVGTGRNIKWHSVGNVGLIDIYWSRDGFVNDSSLVENDHAAGTPGVSAWSVPANEACSTVTFRVYGNTDAVYTESGQMTFSGVVVTSPITGNLAQGASTSITWATVGTLVGSTVDIEYKYITTGPPAATSAWLPLASGTANDGSWTWDPIPAPPAEQAWVKIKKAGAPTGSSQGGEFSISGLVVKVPNGGESWNVGSTHAIEWNIINPTAVGNITIALYKDPGGALVSTLASGVAGADTTWSWNVPPTLATSAFYYIKLTADAVPTISDVSNAYFTVPLDVTMTAPNGGETLTLGVGNTYSITWTDNGVTDPAKLEYTLDNGTTWYNVFGAGAIAAGTNTFTWDLDPATDGNLAASVQCKVRVTTTAGTIVTDMSDAVFTIN